MKKRIVALLLVCFALLICVACGEEETAADKGYTPEKVVARTGDYYLSIADDFTAGKNDWEILALARNGREIPQELFDGYYAEIESNLIANGGVIPEGMNSAYARTALVVQALGRDPSNVGGYDLFAPLNDIETTESQGRNGASWALLAAKACGKSVPDEEYLQFILSSQHEDGGFDISGFDESDVDVTAMILQALSFYRGREDVDRAVEKGLSFLSTAQAEDGGFGTMGAPSAESCAQVLTALCALDIPVDDERFTKDGHTVYDALMSYYLDDATFCHTLELGTSDSLATAQAYYAVVALDRMEKGESFLYALTE